MNRALDEPSSCFAARKVSNRSRVCPGNRSPLVQSTKTRLPSQSFLILLACFSHFKPLKFDANGDASRLNLPILNWSCCRRWCDVAYGSVVMLRRSPAIVVPFAVPSAVCPFEVSIDGSEVCDSMKANPVPTMWFSTFAVCWEFIDVTICSDRCGVANCTDCCSSPIDVFSDWQSEMSLMVRSSIGGMVAREAGLITSGWGSR